MTLKANPPSVRLDFTLEADVATVFRCWTDEALLSAWMGPTPGSRAEVSVDLRVGGRYSFVMGRRASHGEYLAIEEPTYLHFTWVWDDEPEVETEVEVTLTPVAGDPRYTRMVLEHTRLPLEVECLGFESGWRMTVARLVEILVQHHSRPGAPTV